MTDSAVGTYAALTLHDNVRWAEAPSICAKRLARRDGRRWQDATEQIAVGGQHTHRSPP